LQQSGLGIGREIPLPYLVPLAIGTVILVLAILSLRVGRTVNAMAGSQSSKLRWVGLVGAHLLVQTGLALSLMALYSPVVFGLSSPNPSWAMMLYTVVSIPGFALLYLVSRLGSPARPNLMRWLSFISLNAWFVYPITLALLLIYAFPAGTSREALNFGALVMIANLGPALVMVGLSRDYVS